jgi:hypothetical protein
MVSNQMGHVRASITDCGHSSGNNQIGSIRWQEPEAFHDQGKQSECYLLLLNG